MRIKVDIKKVARVGLETTTQGLLQAGSGERKHAFACHTAGVCHGNRVTVE